MAGAPTKRYYLVPGFRIFGAPVYLHISVVVIAVLLGLSAIKSPVYGFVAIASYLSIILVHEAGHAFVAHRLGLGVFNIKISWLHGVCEYEGTPDEWKLILVAWGGVVAQLAVAIVVLILATVTPLEDVGYFGPVVVFLGYLNLGVAAVNLAPSRGLDGVTAWKILPYLIRKRRSRPRTKSAHDQAKKKWGVRD